MEKEQIKKYILKHKDTYPKDKIINQLVKQGANEYQVKGLYNSLVIYSGKNEVKNIVESKQTIQETEQNTNSGLALGLVIGGIIIPLVGFIMTIVGIVLAFQARKIKKDDGMALAAIIIGLGYFAIGILFVLFLLIVFF